MFTIILSLLSFFLFFLSLLSFLQDSAIVVESFKSGFEPPGDYPFEDYSQNLSRTGSDNTISTPKNEGGVKPDPKHSISKTAKNKLWLFGKKPKVRDLSSLNTNTFSHCFSVK